MKKTSHCRLAELFKVISGVALLVSSGCVTRTGEYYQDTRARYVSPVSTTFCRAGQIPVVGWFVFLPIGLVGCGLEIAVVNPVRDTLMLPIDMFQPYHGYYVRVIDESGSPVAGADVGIDGIGHSEMFWSDSGDKGTTGKDGMVYFPHLNYLPSQIDVNADGFHKRRGDMFHVRGVDRDVCPDRAKGPSWSTDAEGRRVYTVRIFRRKRLTALRRIRVDACRWGYYATKAWTNGYDVVNRDWTPPRGRGKNADLVFRNEWLPRKDGGPEERRFSVSVMNERSGLVKLPMLGESDSVCFCTRHEVPETADFEKSIAITDLKMPSHESPELADYIAYRVFRPDGGGKEYYGALTLESWFGTFYHIANPNPGDRSLEPCEEGIDWKHKVSN